ncbi:protein kinase [Streptomyces sp. NPDC088387]|uniref:protein kinase domain-containing protein n=1 Tax=Streptomyces sp. NPDC088387 TaxID=3365859 RepID=UPI0038231DA2
MDGADGFDLSGSGAEPLRAQDPRRIGSIPLVGRLGVGGMGRVYLGIADGRFAAVKQMLASVVAEDQGFVRRFGQEMDNLARLTPRATAPLLASDRTAEPPWFATGYVPGVTLSEAVERDGGGLDGAALWRLLRETAMCLDAVHTLDMVHRDLKPSNVMLTLDGVTLIDFGIARAAEQSRLTRTGLVVGTPAYMSPEQATGGSRLTGASDVFALGLLVAYAASGRWPFGDGAEGSPLYRIVHDEPDLAPVRERDARLADIVAGCLDKDPEGRPTAAELVAATGEHGPSVPLAWPQPVTDVLVERASFAARVPKTPEPHPPAAPTPSARPPIASPPPAAPPMGGDEPAARPGSGSSRPPGRERRRTRIALVAVPIVLIAGGTTLATRLLPYDAGQDRADGAPPATSSAAPAGPAHSPAPAASKSARENPRSPDGKDRGTTPPSGGTANAGVAGGGSESGTQVTSGGSGGSGTADGSASGSDSSASGGSGASGSAGSNSSGGSGGSGGSGESSGSGLPGGDPPPQPSSGTFRLKNADNGNCLIPVYGSADDGSCAETSASWKTVSAENNGFTVVNKESGRCLVANMLGQAVFVGDCTQGTARLWRWGSGGTLTSVANGGCLDLAHGGGVSANRCTPGQASQNWRRT